MLQRLNLDLVMKKKALSQRQLRRIEKQHESFAARAESGAVDKNEPPNDELGPEQSGLVIANYGQQLDIEALDGPTQGQVFRCHQRSNLTSPVAGDRVIWRAGPETGVVVASLPRQNVLQRPSPLGELKPVAANVDQLIIVIAPEPKAHANLIDRYLIAAENSGLNALILLNKVDLLTPALAPEFEELLARYEGIGYPTLRCSCREGNGLDALKKVLAAHTSIFVGQSGVGKSALVNALLPDAQNPEGKLSHAKEKGRHTTTTARLFHLSDGGMLIDSPGIREFGMWHMDEDAVWSGFREFRPLLGRCRFRDCGHRNEPGCAILTAVEAGEISVDRLQSCRHILQSLNE